MQTFMFIAFSIILSAGLANAGECCRAYTDVTGENHPAQYCSNFCCYEFLKYDCCDNELLHQAAIANGQVDSFCAAWFESHVWAAVLIGIAGLAILITLATCCCCCCCGFCGTCCGCCDRRNPGTVIVTSPPAQPHVMLMQTETRTPVAYGYDQ
ncbi:hypothetical protein ACJMK2_031428 [Sinanodonta woodiana]|uniref:Uncharacterized protein n=1 Tax=Sinanodonta woodiana TaxID=1069815 RepID=A0ABD3X2P9_SINWO